MAGLGPAIHDLKQKTWMPGPSPGMTLLTGRSARPRNSYARL